LIKVHADLHQHWRLLKTAFEAIGNQFLPVAKLVDQGTPYQVKIVLSAKFQVDPLCRILRVLPKSSFKRLLLETPLWQYAMSSNLKPPPKGLKNAKCEKGTPPIRTPIPYVPPTDLHEKRETEQIKVELPNGTKFQMPTYGSGNNKEYPVQVIAVQRLVKQKGTATKVKKAFAALVMVRKEMSPFFNFPKDKTVAKKEARKKKLSNLKTSPSRPRNPLRLNRPRRTTSCSIALLAARGKCNGTGL
jgi:hypothetical protein